MSALLVINAAAVIGTFTLFHATLGYGFYYDDYYFMKPYTGTDVLAAFAGTWDAGGVMVPFYRPLTVAFYALRFHAVGLNAVAHHMVSLALFAVAATLAGTLARRITGETAVGVLAAAVFVLHPSMPYAQVVWITNQMHLLSSVLVLSALIYWHLMASRPIACWIPLLGLAVAAFFVKEDNIMLLPSILALHWLRRHMMEPSLPRVSLVFGVTAALLCVGLVVLRHEALGGLGGYGQPTPDLAWTNFKKGISRVFWLLPADRPWQPISSAAAILLPVLAGLCWRRTPPGSRLLVASGAALGLLFNLPFVFVTKNEQMHLVAAGASLMLTGCIAGVLQSVHLRPLRVGVAGAAIAVMAAWGAVAVDISRDFEPFGPIVLSSDEIVRGWHAVPVEIREYLARKPEAREDKRPGTNPTDEVPVVGYGMHSVETSAEGLVYRWMAQAKAELHVAASAREITIPVRHDAGAFREPTAAIITLDGTVAEQTTFADGEWRSLRYNLRPRQVSRFSRMHRITLEIPHAWVPARVIPGSTDGRVLGLQIGQVRIR